MPLISILKNAESANVPARETKTGTRNKIAHTKQDCTIGFGPKKCARVCLGKIGDASGASYGFIISKILISYDVIGGVQIPGTKIVIRQVLK